MTATPFLQSLHFYPIKSCHAVDLRSAHVGERGLAVGKIIDRSWMLIDEAGDFVSQRKIPRLAQIRIGLRQSRAVNFVDSITASAPGMHSLTLNPDSYSDEIVTATLHKKQVVGHVVSAAASQWFSDFLGAPVRLLFQTEADHRVRDKNFGGDEGSELVSFADGFQYLLANQGTLDELNLRMNAVVPMTRFRPNIVVANAAADAEYSWKSVMIGEAKLNLVKPCTRCVMTTIDQEQGIKTGNEPLASLTRSHFLSQDFGAAKVQGTIFGENGVPVIYGDIEVGDAVKVMEEKPIYNFRRTVGSPAVI